MARNRIITDNEGIPAAYDDLSDRTYSPDSMGSSAQENCLETIKKIVLKVTGCNKPACLRDLTWKFNGSRWTLELGTLDETLVFAYHDATRLFILKEGESRVVTVQDLYKIDFHAPFSSLAAALPSNLFGNILRCFLRGLFTLHTPSTINVPTQCKFVHEFSRALKIIYQAHGQTQHSMPHSPEPGHRDTGEAASSGRTSYSRSEVNLTPSLIVKLKITHFSQFLFAPGASPGPNDAEANTRQPQARTTPPLPSMVAGFHARQKEAPPKHTNLKEGYALMYKRRFTEQTSSLQSAATKLSESSRDTPSHSCTNRPLPAGDVGTPTQAPSIREESAAKLSRNGCGLLQDPERTAVNQYTQDEEEIPVMESIAYDFESSTRPGTSDILLKYKNIFERLLEVKAQVLQHFIVIRGYTTEISMLETQISALTTEKFRGERNAAKVGLAATKALQATEQVYFRLANAERKRLEAEKENLKDKGGLTLIFEFYRKYEVMSKAKRKRVSE
ncbi:Nn.00g117640.m01.CDS01 [Neocucurbitaria sp. VM-36]